jgi:hypothetical protein
LRLPAFWLLIVTYGIASTSTDEANSPPRLETGININQIL